MEIRKLNCLTNQLYKIDLSSTLLFSKKMSFFKLFQAEILEKTVHIQK